MGRTVEELLASIDPVELQYWFVYSGVEPIGGARSDFLAALTCTTIGRAQGAKVDLDEFVPQWWAQRVKATPAEVFREWFKDRVRRKIGK